MYTDEKWCGACRYHGISNDGENYCIQCKTYLCLSCALTHGQHCINEAETTGQIRDERKDVESVNETNTDVWEYKSSKCDHTTPFHDNTKRNVSSKSGYTNPHIQTLRLNTEHKVNSAQDFMTASFDNEFTNIKEAGKISTDANTEQSNSVRHTPKDIETNQEKSYRKRPGDSRQNFSARGGTVKIQQSPSNEERVKLQRCTRHPELNIENFCNIHEALCCEVCLNSEHKHCIVQPIDEVAHGVVESQELVNVVKEFDYLKKMNKDMTIVCEQLLDQMQSNVVTEIRVTSTNVTDEEVVDKHGADIDMNMIHMERMVIKCKELDENISLCIQEIQNSKDNGSELLAFITLQKNKQIIAIVKTKFQKLFAIDDAHIRSVPSEDRRTYGSPVNGDEAELETGENIHDRNSPSAPDASRKKETELQDYIDQCNGDLRCGVKSNVNGNIISKTMIIGEVVLCSREKLELDYCTANTKRMDYEDYIIKENTKSDVTVPPEPECDEHGNTNSLASIGTQRINRPISNDKYVAFCRQPICMFRKPSKDRIIANGLVTDYYMNDDFELLDDIRVLRLQSAPPTRSPITNKDTHQRPKNMHFTAQRDMVQWQNRKLLESVEHKRESNASDESTLNPTKESYGGATSGERKHFRRRKVFESSKSELKDKLKINQHNHTHKTKQLQRTRRENAYIQNNKCCQVKKMDLSVKQSSGSGLKSAAKNYETSTETTRLRKWIIQTEEMNQMHQKVNTRVSGMETKTTDGVDEVYEANVDEYLSDFKVEQYNLSMVPLMVKEAQVIQIANSDDRQSSARSRTSDTEEDIYNNQSYAIRPTTQLFLTVEQIVRLPEDEKTCEINSISCMPDGRIIVSDYNNKLIKLFRVGWGRASSLYLDEPPHGVTVVANTTLAVISGLAYDRLLVINVGQYLTIKRRFKTGCVCRSICSFESHIYLLCLYRYKTEIRILNTDGVVSIRMNLGHAIPSPKSIAINPTDGLIYIADQSRGIFVVNRGRIVSRSSDRNIESYYDVVIDINNNVFVCTNNPCRIYELSYDGTHMMPILLEYGMEDVRAIGFNAANNSLVAGCANSETIQIYKMIDTLLLKEKQSV